MFLIQKGARECARLVFVDCPRHGLRWAMFDGRCPAQGCTHRLPKPWTNYRAYDVASWKPICYRAYRAHVRNQLRRVADGRLDPDEADYHPLPSHLLTAHDVA